MRARLISSALALAGALMLFGAPATLGRVRNVWVAAVPTWCNVAPNGHDAIMGMPVNPADAIFPTVVYRRYTADWHSASRTRFAVHGPVRARIALLGRDGWTALALSHAVQVTRGR